MYHDNYMSDCILRDVYHRFPEISGLYLKGKCPNNVILFAAIMTITFDLLKVIS